MRICQPPENSSVWRVQSSLPKAQAAEHGAHLRIEGVSVAGLEFVLDALVALGDLRIFRRRVVDFGHARGQVFHLLLHGAQFVEHRHAFGENAAAGERKPVLRQIAGADALGGAEGAVVEGLHPARIFSSVDLPVPFAPTSPTRSLGVISQSAPSKRSLWP